MKLNQRGGSRTDTLVKLILVFFISLLSFSVGTFVGKQFSDSQHRLAALENEYNKDSGEGRDVASIPEGDDSQPKEILSNEDVAKLAEEFVQEKPGARKVAAEGESKEEHKDAKPVELKDVKKDEHAVKDEHSIPVVGSLKQQKQMIEKLTHAPTHEATPGLAAEKIAADKAPLAAVKPKIELKKEDKALPATVSADAKGKYTIQVSSHQTENEAKNRVEELKNKGFVASYIPAEIDGKTWYRVGIGTFTTVKSAKEYLSKLKEDSNFKSAIIRQVASFQ
jgi:cell division protein FtsN